MSLTDFVHRNRGRVDFFLKDDFLNLNEYTIAMSDRNMVAAHCYYELTDEEIAYVNEKLVSSHGLDAVTGPIIVSSYRALAADFYDRYVVNGSGVNIPISTPAGNYTCRFMGHPDCESPASYSVAIDAISAQLTTAIKELELGHRFYMQIAKNHNTRHITDPFNYRFLNTDQVLVVFDSTWNPDETPNNSENFVSYHFQDLPNAELTAIPVTVSNRKIESAIGVYHSSSSPEAAPVIVVPIAFKSITGTGTSHSQKRNKLKNFLYKLAKNLKDSLYDEEAAQKKVKKSLVALVNSSFEQAKRSKQMELENTRHAIESLNQQLIASMNRRNILALELEGIQTANKAQEESMATLGEEYDELVRRRLVKKLSVSNHYIVLETNFMYFTNPKTNVIHQLGEMVVSVDSRTYQMTFLNKTHKFHGTFDHPHINNGSPCLGNFGIGLPELLMQGRVAVFYDMIFSFLETCNPDDAWGKHAVYWPIKDESKATEEWKSIKEYREKNLIMPMAKEPEPPKTDEQLLDEFGEKKTKKKKTAPEATENTVVDTAEVEGFTGEALNDIVRREDARILNRTTAAIFDEFNQLTEQQRPRVSPMRARATTVLRTPTRPVYHTADFDERVIPNPNAGPYDVPEQEEPNWGADWEDEPNTEYGVEDVLAVIDAYDEPATGTDD